MPIYNTYFNDLNAGANPERNNPNEIFIGEGSIQSPINSSYSGLECCKKCLNNPLNNPNASGFCNCVLPTMEQIRY